MAKILIIEDEPVLLKILTEKFRSVGWIVAGASDGEEGMDLIGKSTFDVVLLDLLLPKKDGFQVLREVRAVSGLKDLPILIISNLGSEDDIRMAIDLGATDYLIKTQHSLKEIVEKTSSYIKN